MIRWRGKPVFIKKRTDEELADINAVDWKTLRDPQSDKARRIKEELLVVLGVCTVIHTLLNPVVPYRHVRQPPAQDFWGKVGKLM